ncbi:MAG: hypothetical protein GXP03_08080 [Alphaproteobacteria bacterium]|nr:hypothetical protein [Alphaproteobacteria bacterium]
MLGYKAKALLIAVAIATSLASFANAGSNGGRPIELTKGCLKWPQIEATEVVPKLPFMIDKAAHGRGTFRIGKDSLGRPSVEIRFISNDDYSCTRVLSVNTTDNMPIKLRPADFSTLEEWHANASPKEVNAYDSFIKYCKFQMALGRDDFVGSSTFRDRETGAIVTSSEFAGCDLVTANRSFVFLIPVGEDDYRITQIGAKTFVRIEE